MFYCVNISVELDPLVPCCYWLGNKKGIWPVVLLQRFSKDNLFAPGLT